MNYYYCELKENGKDGLVKAVAAAPNGPAAVDKIKMRVCETR